MSLIGVFLNTGTGRRFETATENLLRYVRVSSVHMLSINQNQSYYRTNHKRKLTKILS